MGHAVQSGQLPVPAKLRMAIFLLNQQLQSTTEQIDTKNRQYTDILIFRLLVL